MIQQPFDGRFQLINANRLVEIGGDAESLQRLFDAGIAKGRDQDDRAGRHDNAQATDVPKPSSGHPQVGQDQAGNRFPGPFDGLISISGLDDPAPQIPQFVAEQAAHVLVILRDQHHFLIPGFHRSLPTRTRGPACSYAKNMLTPARCFRLELRLFKADWEGGVSELMLKATPREETPVQDTPVPGGS